MKCLGRLCPPSLDMINTPQFVRRAGIIPYVAPTTSSSGKVLLGVKEGKYTDFGGGCKIAKMELPFQCAVREMREEIGEEIIPDLDRITHIFISGKIKPHQIVLFIRMNDLSVPSNIPEGELDLVEIVSFPTLARLDRRWLSDSLKSIYDNLLTIASGKEKR